MYQLKAHSTILIGLLLIMLPSCSAPVPEKRIEWKSKQIDLGKFDYGGTTEGTFTFYNHQSTQVLIREVVPGCDCTSIPDYTKQPVLPGDSGFIRVVYNTHKGIIGPLRKNLFVFFDGTRDSVQTLYYSGEVTGHK